jgi:Ca-activated chloride channel homolog
MKKITLVLSLIVLLVGLSVAAAGAQEATPTPAEPICIDCIIPEPPAWNFDGLEIPYQRVDVTIADQVATTRIEQVFRNPNDWLLEGTYFFPLPKGAAVSQLTMWVDGVPIEAKILDRDEARGIYDAIVRQLRDPALLEYVGQDAIQANVFPIPPNDERKIEIEYSQLLTADNGIFHFVYPQSADLYTNTPLDEQRIRVDLASNEAIRTIYSPSHRVAVSRDGDFEATVGYEDTNVTPADDFELYYTVTPEDIGLNLLSSKAAGEEGFFLLLVAPGIEPGEVVAKDVILVLDTSGSMEGQKMAQAQAAAIYVLEHLNPEDRFAVVSFSTGVSLYEPQLRAAGEPGAVQYVNSLFAAGGTNISSALLEAANLVDRERPATIIFLTDGLATEGITDTGLLVENVGAALPANARLFAFGVGDDVDTTLLDTLAANHRGATTYVRPGQAVDEAVSAFYAKVGTPVLTDIAIDYGGARVDQVYPVLLPDLFAGTQLVIAGRYRDGGPATITLTGTANGREQTFTYADQTFRDEGGEDFIARLWATRAIGHLMQQIRLRGEDPELVQSVVNLSTRYGIITPYTSFLIEEDDIFTQSGAPVMEEAMEALAAPAMVSGEAAVDRAEMEGFLAAAEAPLPMATTVVSAAGSVAQTQPVVQTAGNRTFFLRGGVWVDSAYDPQHMTEPQLITFASDAYFELLSNRPELGQALALGEEIILVVDEQAYRITGADGTADPGEVSLSTPGPTGPTGESAQVDSGAEREESPPASSGGLQVCGLGLALPLAVLAGMGLDRRRRSRNR